MSNAFALLVNGLPQHGWTISLVDTSDRSALRRRASFSLRRALGVAAILARSCLPILRADVVYVAISQSAVGFAKDAPMLLLARALRRPTVVHLHGAAFEQFSHNQNALLRRIITIAYQRTARFVVLSEPLRSQFSIVRGSELRTVVIRNGIPVPEHIPMRHPPNRRIRLLFLSNMHVEKGYVDVLDAIPLIARALSGWRIEAHFAGAFAPGGPFLTVQEMKSDFEKRVASACRYATITYHGVVVGSTKRDLLATCDLLVLPSRLPEGQPLSILEALSYGMPVVASNCPGIRGSIPAEMTGLLVEPRQPDALAERVVALARNPDTYAAMSTAARLHSKLYRESEHVAAIHEVLRNAAQDAAASS